MSASPDQQGTVFSSRARTQPTVAALNVLSHTRAAEVMIVLVYISTGTIMKIYECGTEADSIATCKAGWLASDQERLMKIKV